MNNDLFEHIACNLCGGTADTEVFKSTLPDDLSLPLTERYAPAAHASGNDRIVRCNACGLVYANPRMKRELIWQGYADAPDMKYATQGKDRIATFDRAVRDIESFYPQKGLLLDVGCAAGFFLKAAKDRGWDAQGIEPNKGLAEWGSKEFGATIHQKDFLEAALPDNSVDVVTFWDVLEHVTDPSAYLKECHRILKPGGIVVVNYPDFGSPLAKIAGQRWWFLSPVHIYYFTRTTMARLLAKEHFELVISRRHWQTLSLGYLASRFDAYSKVLSKLGTSVITALGLSRLPIRYYAAQALTVAKKSR